MRENKTIIAFDVDETLITEKFEPIYENIWLLQSLSGLSNVEILVWSGGGQDYAEHQVYKLGLQPLVTHFADKSKQSAEFYQVDLTFDDQEVILGKVNIKVK